MSQVTAQSTPMKFSNDFLSQGPLWNAQFIGFKQEATVYQEVTHILVGAAFVPHFLEVFVIAVLVL